MTNCISSYSRGGLMHCGNLLAGYGRLSAPRMGDTVEENDLFATEDNLGAND